MSVEHVTRTMWNGTVRALPLIEKLKAASIAGCEILAIAPSDYVEWLSTSITSRDMLSMAADAGVRLAHLDPFVRWVDDWRPASPIEQLPTDWIAFDKDDFFRMASALEARSFTAWAAFPTGRYETPALVDAFGALCRRAELEGMRCDLEFIPGSGVPDLRAGWALLEGARASNSGLVVDLWHYMRSGRNDDLLGSIPSSKIAAVQLCDDTANLPAGMSLMEDCLNHRLLPGEGAFPIDEIVAVLRSRGSLHNLGLEVFSPRFDLMDARTIGQITRGVLDRYSNEIV